MVNTCGFVEAAKKDSVDTLLAAADLKETGRARAVVAVGCLAERYGTRAGRGDAGGGCRARLRRLRRRGRHGCSSILAGQRHRAHVPRDRRRLLPISSGRPAGRGGGRRRAGHIAPASGPRTTAAHAPGRVGPDGAGQDRFRLRPALHVLRHPGVPRRLRLPPAWPRSCAEARWLAADGVRELFLVSENTSSYGKDLGDLRLLEQLLTELSAVDGLDWIRVSYLQPAEMRPSLVAAMAGTDKVVPYFDLSFQHARARRAAADAPVRRPGLLPGPGRPDPRGRPGGRDPLQRDLRLPGRDRGRPDAVCTSS